MRRCRRHHVIVVVVLIARNGSLVVVVANGMTAHLHAQAKIVTLEEFVVVGSRLGTARDASKIPTVELSSEGGEFGFLKVFGHEFRREALLVENQKAATVREPGDDIGIFLVGKNFHQLFENVCVGVCVFVCVDK